MMKASKLFCLFLVMVLMMGVLLPVEARAIDLIDDQTVSLDITSKTGDVVLKNETFLLYKVADADQQCRFTVTGGFSSLTTSDALNSMTDESWQALNEELFQNVVEHPEKFTAAYEGRTNDSGVAHFQVERGLYLIVGPTHTQDNKQYAQKPILIMLPNREADSETWDYNVKINTKPGDVTIIKKVKVIKLWDDKNDQDKLRPKELKVWILRDDGKKLEYTLTAKENWEHTWTDLEPGHNWIAAGENLEKAKDAYKLVSINRVDGEDIITFTIKNSHPVKPPKLPQTGQLWWPVPVLLCLGLGCILVGMIRRKGEKNEA